MFKRQAEPLGTILARVLREQGLETPLQQRRVVDLWEQVVGTNVMRYTGDKFVKNQTLYVKITNPALRQNLSMMRQQLVKRLNEAVGSVVIYDIHIY